MHSYPKVGEVFELTLDFDAAENQPLEMVRRDGYDPRVWNYTGKKVMGRCTSYFKLVKVGYCRNLDQVRQKLAAHGEIPEGQWRQAFKAAYPKPDRKGLIGVADPSWALSGGSATFPCVSSRGRSRFLWADRGFNVAWRWLVKVRE
ncbi:MAG: hypothetical protein G01um101430_739 [Parcubacteria group bacterium Gr01-1014_30]|nr:MAG: hypothetical protein G01um101430_739 [Parcubacteria group bacterium Gr01-1014_30]